MSPLAERRVSCCIAGGGPAGMLAGYLLSRAGVDVLVLEKHADFLRDFRGDTIHPSTLAVIDELGLLEQFLRLPHQKAEQLSGRIGETVLELADFRHLPVKSRFIVLMPQWDFLNFFAEQGRGFRGFSLLMEAEATGLVEEDGRVVGLQAATPNGPLEIRADLVLGADGRHSTVREAANLHRKTLGAPMDVLWFRLARQDSDPNETFGRINAGAILILINRLTYWQCGFVIAKGSVETLRAAGIAAFQARLATFAPFLANRAQQIDAWDKVSLLSVAVDRLERWYRSGLLCIGDAAHAMSPIGGVGINLAVQDAVAAANILALPLREHRLTEANLAAVQRRREFPTRATQRLQVFLQNRVISRVLGTDQPIVAPAALRLLAAIPPLRRIPARVIGMGFRPEHVRLPPMP
ncbi:MAG: FAD-dependent oxidoreductase [Acetobacteraceae bacterium]|nr:FAD-dependent oxidoreductase [Acetobacteraceae bacterium]